MNLKEKTELKIEILQDIRSCFSFNLGALEYNLNHFKLNNLIESYQIALKEIEKHENKD